MTHRNNDIARGLRLWRARILLRGLHFCLGLGILLGVGAVLMGVWWMGIPLVVGSMVLYDLALKWVVRRD